MTREQTEQSEQRRDRQSLVASAPPSRAPSQLRVSASAPSLGAKRSERPESVELIHAQALPSRTLLAARGGAGGGLQLDRLRAKGQQFNHSRSRSYQRHSSFLFEPTSDPLAPFNALVQHRPNSLRPTSGVVDSNGDFLRPSTAHSMPGAPLFKLGLSPSASLGALTTLRSASSRAVVRLSPTSLARETYMRSFTHDRASKRLRSRSLQGTGAGKGGGGGRAQYVFRSDRY
jgi:hypothetical protein